MLWNGLWTVDAGELLVSASQFRLAHPPGYPLYILLVRSVIFLTGGNLVSAGNLLSLICSVLSLLLLVKTSFLINKRLSRVLLLSLIGVLVSTRLWILYSVTQEVFMLTILFLCLINYLVMRILHSDKMTAADLYVLVCVFSFALFHQYIVLFYLPIILYLLLRFRQNITFQFIFTLSLIFLGGFVPYLFFVRTDPSMYQPWAKSDTILSLLKIALRENYGFFTLFESSFTQPIGNRFNSVLLYITSVARDWHVLFLPVSLFGVLFSLKRFNNRRVALFILYCWLVLSIILFFIYTVDSKALFTTAIVERFYLLSYPFVFLGLVLFFDSITEYVSQQRKLYINCLVCLLFMVALFLGIRSFRLAKLARANNTVELFGKETLKLLPKNSILIVSADVYRFPIEYASFVEHIRPDVTVIPTTVIGSEKLFQLNKAWMKGNGIITSYTPHTVHKFITVNSVKRPIFINYDISDLNGLVQVGTIFHYRKGPFAQSVELRNLQSYFTSFPSENIRLEEKFPLYGIEHTRDYIRKGALSLAKQYFEKGDYDNSFYFLQQAHRIKSGKDTYLSLGLIKYRQDDCKGARVYWKEGFEQLVDREFPLRLSQLEAACFKNLQQAHFWNYIYSTIKQRE